MSDFDILAADLDAAARTAVRRVRGITAKHANQMAADAKSKALASWTTYGRGEAGAAGTIRARMSRDRSQPVGYVLADGQGAFQAEHGKHDRAPDPVIGQAVEAHTDGWLQDLTDQMGDLL